MTTRAKCRGKGLRCQWQSSDMKRTIKAVEEKDWSLQSIKRI